MKKHDIFRVKEQNYASLRKALDTTELSPEILAVLNLVLDDHQGFTTAAKAAIKKQLKEVSGLFSFDSLFADAPKPDLSSGADPAQSPEIDAPGFLPDNDEALKKKAAQIGRKLPKKIVHKLDLSDLKCPGCHKNMHKAHSKSVTVIRLVGLTEENHQIETCRCLTCGTSGEAQNSVSAEKLIGQFTLDCAAVMCALRYGNGMPSFRLEEVTACMGYRIPDSTQWDLFQNCASELNGFFVYLRTTAQTAGVVQMDDTSVRINELTQQFKLQKDGTLVGTERTGVHTTGYIAKFDAGKICLFASGLHHAGEIFEQLNKARTTEEQVILMVDAAPSNTCKIKNMDVEVVQANCNSHAVRKFKELETNAVYEEHVSQILELYRAAFSTERALADKSPAEKLAMHKQHSLPKLLAIKEKIQKDFEERIIEPNSPLGAAYKYYLNHFEKLTAFCRHEGAPLCNNECERLLKRAIRHRKNSLFFKNLVGAAVGDIHMTILLTAKENGLNPVQYMTALLQFEKERNAQPEDFLPWNFPATLQKLQAQNSTTTST
jgi:transposase